MPSVYSNSIGSSSVDVGGDLGDEVVQARRDRCVLARAGRAGHDDKPGREAECVGDVGWDTHFLRGRDPPIDQPDRCRGAGEGALHGRPSAEVSRPTKRCDPLERGGVPTSRTAGEQALGELVDRALNDRGHLQDVQRLLPLDLHQAAVRRQMQVRAALCPEGIDPLRYLVGDHRSAPPPRTRRASAESVTCFWMSSARLSRNDVDCASAMLCNSTLDRPSIIASTSSLFFTRTSWIA